MINFYMSEKNIKKHNPYRKEYILNPATCIYENGEYLASSIDY